MYKYITVCHSHRY